MGQGEKMVGNRSRVVIHWCLLSSATLSLIKMTHEVGIGSTPSNVQLPRELVICPWALLLASCCRKEGKVVAWFGAHGIAHGIPK